MLIRSIFTQTMLTLVSIFAFPAIASADSTYQLNSITVHVTYYDITKMNVDAIVNAANKSLPWPAGGVCKAIYLAADPGQLDPWVKANVPLNANRNRIHWGMRLLRQALI